MKKILICILWIGLLTVLVCILSGCSAKDENTTTKSTTTGVKSNTSKNNTATSNNTRSESS